mgnify:FL=1
MSKSKIYKVDNEDVSSKVKETSPVYGGSQKQQIPVTSLKRENNFTHAISGEELLNRLRPRIKSMFE